MASRGLESKSVRVRWSVLDEYLALAGWNGNTLASRFEYSKAAISIWKKRQCIPVYVLNQICEDLKLKPEQFLHAPKKEKPTPESKLNELKARFSAHHLDEPGIRRLQHITQQTRELALLIESVCPDNRDKNHAITLLKGVQMYANSSISQEYPYNEI